VDRPEPEYAIGQRVRVVLNERNRTPHEGSIRAVIWHHREGRFHYYLEERGRKVSKRYAAEDLQLIRKRSMETIRLLLPLWTKLDELLSREFMCWPWESDNPEVKAVWERLTHSDNLTALEDWAQGVESFNDFARGCTLRALAECRSRRARQAEPGTGPNPDT
jgi:hypothetical protein